MQELLDKILISYLMKEFPENDNHELFARMFKKEISDLIIKEHIKTIQEEQEKKRAELALIKKNEKLKEKLNEARDILVVAVVIGLLVGLLANQGTEIVYYMKGNGFNFLETLGCMVIIIILIWVAYRELFIKKLFE